MAIEITLDLSNCPISYGNTSTEAGNFISHFRIGSTAFSTNQVFAISYSALQALEAAMNDGTRSNETFARALRIYHGISSNILKPVFVPVYMDLDTNTTDEFDVTPYPLSNATNIYLYNGNSFDAITLNMAQDCIGDYETNIKIKHKDNEEFSAFDSETDVACVTFPFQEINKLYADNSDIIGSDLYFYNTSKADANGEYKHELIIMPFSSFSPTNSTIGGIFSNNAANMGALCPPSCDRVIYPVI